MLERIRAAAGPDPVIVATLDLHANLSERMVDATTMLIGYQTNPHVDMLERGEEAALATRTILAGQATPHSAFVRLPLTPPSVTLLTADGPYGELIDLAQRRRRELGGAILNATVLGGFVFGDTPKNGLSVVVTARHRPGPAAALAEEIASRAWAMRERFKRELTPIDEAVALAQRVWDDPSAAPVIFSDAGDNPGGGGSGTASALLEALIRARVPGVLFGAFFDPALAADAHAAGEGAELDVVLNREAGRAGSDPAGRRVESRARVLALCDGETVGRRGIYAGRTLDLGASCALELGGTNGVVVVVISERAQTADPVFFEMLGLDVGAARTVCVKSRGHFRAGFDEWFEPEQVFEVDTPGWTSPVLERFDWRGLPRPVYPLDEDATWSVGG